MRRPRNRKHATTKSASKSARPAKVRPKTSIRASDKVTKTKKSARDPLESLIGAAARALDLKIGTAWRPAILANLHMIFSQAALVAEFALPDDAEPAPVFQS